MTDRYELATTRVLAGMLRRDPSALHPRLRLFLDLGLTSANALELVMRLEDELDLDLRTEALDWRHLETLDALTGYVRAAGTGSPDSGSPDSAHP